MRNNTWDDFIHDLKEFLALGFALPCAVFHVADGLLLHPDAPPLLDTPIISAIDACAYHDLISDSLRQVFRRGHLVSLDKRFGV